MNRFHLATVPAMLLTLAASPLVAQPEPSLDLRAEEASKVLDAMAPTNAALVYYQLFMLQDNTIEEASWNFDFEPADPETLYMTQDEAAQKLIDSQELIERYIWASRLPECDFGLQFQDGWKVLLPHLGKLRLMTRVLRADALRLAELGEFDQAADRVEAILGFADQVRHDRVLISSLVGIAMTSHASTTARYLVESDQLTAEGRDRLIERLEAMQTDDYFRMRDCMTMEYTVSVGWIAKMPLESKPSEWLAGFDNGDESLAVISRLDAMNRSTLLGDAERMNDYFKRVAEVWDDPEAVAKLEAIGALVGVGAFGEAGRVFLAHMGKAKEQDLRIKADIEDTLNALYVYRPHTDDDDAKPAADATDPTPEQ